MIPIHEIEDRNMLYEHSFRTLLAMHKTWPKPIEVCMHMSMVLDEGPEKVLELLVELKKLEEK